MLARSLKKSTGSYYTPEHLARLISTETIFAWLSELSRGTIQNLIDLNTLTDEQRNSFIDKINGIKILDPSVGEGVFLLACAEILNDILTALGDDRSENHRKRSIASRNLFGVDLAKQAISTSKRRLGGWAGIDSVPNIRRGNTLVGFIDFAETPVNLDEKMEPFHWGKEFPEVFSRSSHGFDVIVGNPPYGNILGKLERQYIDRSYPFNIGGNRTGTWNSAAHFIVRAMALLNTGGQLGFLVPNSVLRVKQFTKTREFLLMNSRLRKIVDEGSPFEGVTLEMVSLFIDRKTTSRNQAVSVESRRTGLEQSNSVSLTVLNNTKIFPLYFDDIFKNILEKGSRNQLIAVRGRDIPKKNTRREADSAYSIPYITSGRSVRRYHLDSKHLIYTDDWFHQDSALTESFENEFLVATKNYRYPRCILKPTGIIHGGGIVKIIPQFEKVDLRVLGLILNSKLIRNICVRYLTNYSQLTCCLNTGIMEELPIVFPERPIIYSLLFDSLTSTYSNQNAQSLETRVWLERLSDALVYSMYLQEDQELEGLVEDRVKDKTRPTYDIHSLTGVADIEHAVDEILNDATVMKLELLGDYPPREKSLRY
jgi:hypothetical protein